MPLHNLREMWERKTETLLFGSSAPPFFVSFFFPCVVWQFGGLLFSHLIRFFLALLCLGFNPLPHVKTWLYSC